MTSPTQIWCLRHGESSRVDVGFPGAVAGAALTSTGRDQAVAAAAILAALPRRPTRIYASTALGAIQTADVLAGALGLTHPLIPLNGLIEVADGESGPAVVTRMSSALRRVADHHPGGVVALVGHVASLTAGVAALCGITPRPLPPAVPFRVETDGATFHCSTWPD